MLHGHIQSWNNANELVLLTTLVLQGVFRHNFSNSPTPAACPIVQFGSLLTLSTSGQHQNPHIRGSVPYDCSHLGCPSPGPAPTLSSDLPAINSKSSHNPLNRFDNLIERLTGLSQLLYINYFQFTIKTEEQSWASPRSKIWLRSSQRKGMHHARHRGKEVEIICPV